MMMGYGTYDAVIDTLESALKGRDYIAGERFTGADIYLGSHIGFGMEFGTIEKRPVFESYWRRLAARPAGLRAKEIDDALMPQHPIPGPPGG